MGSNPNHTAPLYLPLPISPNPSLPAPWPPGPPIHPGQSETSYVFVSDVISAADNADPPGSAGSGGPPFRYGDVDFWDVDNGSVLLNVSVWDPGEGGEGGEDFNWGILLLAPLVVFGIGGNTLVILAVSLEKRLQNVTNYFLLSLAVTDCLVSLIVMPLSIINEFTGRWLFGVILCNLFVTADVLMCTSSILHLCTISLERYIGIRYPLWAKSKSKRTAFFKIVLVWTLAIAITSPITVLGAVSHSNILQDGQCLLANQHFIIYGSIFAFFIPLTIMVLMYALTVRMLNKQAKLCSGGVASGSGAGAGAGESGGEPVIRRSTSRKHWQRQTRHTVQGTSSRSYRREALAAANSYPGGGSGSGSGTSRFVPRYQALSKRNTLPLYHDRKPSVPRETDELEYCNGNGEGGSEERSEPKAKSTWRAALATRKARSNVSKAGEPNNLKDLAQKHHVAVKAANALLLRKDMVRKETTSSVQTEQKASKVLGVVFMIFVICWAPFFLVNILQVLCVDCHFSPTLFTVFVWLGYVSSTLNPIIYTVFNKVFKLTFLKLLCCRYSHLHRGRRRSNHSVTLGLMSRCTAVSSSGATANGSGTSSSHSGVITCSPVCRNNGGGHVEESMC